MEKLVQTLIVSIFFTLVVGIICSTVIEVNKPTKEEIKLRALEVKEHLTSQRSSAENLQFILDLDKRIYEADSIMTDTKELLTD